MDISRIGAQISPTTASARPVTPDGPAFGAALADSFGRVDQNLQGADQAITALATGQADHLHQAMIAVEQAGISLELMLQIRNKIIAAYDEISRMQM